MRGGDVLLSPADSDTHKRDLLVQDQSRRPLAATPEQLAEFTLTLDGGCGRGGKLLAGLLDGGGRVQAIYEA